MPSKFTDTKKQKQKQKQKQQKALLEKKITKKKKPRPTGDMTLSTEDMTLSTEDMEDPLSSEDITLPTKDMESELDEIEKKEREEALNEASVLMQEIERSKRKIKVHPIPNLDDIGGGKTKRKTRRSKRKLKRSKRNTRRSKRTSKRRST
jgi:hypothetical protein